MERRRDRLSFGLADPVAEVAAGECVAHLMHKVVAGDHLDLAGPHRIQQQRGMAVRLADHCRDEDAGVEDESGHAEARRAS
jgi:hypothetical protein